jgi:DNA-binding MarR family transcriptional regulator
MRAREVLLPGGMNPVFFGLKRAYHSTLRIGRANFRALQLTAARFDLLYALTDRGRPRNEATRQSVLRRMLGVSRPTVSRMLRSLEELGFVRRQRSEVDRRQLEVRLTGYGRGCVRAAFRSLVRSGWSLIAPDCALNWRRATDDERLRWERCMFRTKRFEARLMDLRVACRDLATLTYRWYPLEE